MKSTALDREQDNHLSALARQRAAFSTLDENEFEAVSMDANCFLLLDKTLLNNLLTSAAVITQVSPATVYADGLRFPAALTLAGAQLSLRLDPGLRLPEMSAATALVSFNLFESSFCFAGRVLESDPETLVLDWPERFYLRRRRHQDRLLLSYPLPAGLILHNNHLRAWVHNLNEHGAGLSMSLPQEINTNDLKEVFIELPTGESRIAASLRWTRQVDHQLFLGVEFNRIEPEIRFLLTEKRRVRRKEFQPGLPCQILTSEGTPVPAEATDLSELGARIRIPENQMPAGTGPWKINLVLEGIKTCLDAEQRWSRTEGEYRVLGLRFFTMAGEARENLLRFLLPLMRPNVGELRPDELDQVLRLYEQVNYFGAIDKSDTSRPILAEASETWSKILQTGRDLGTFICVREGDRVTGAIGMSRVYANTWLSHSMAAVHGSSSIPTEHLRLGQIEQMERESTTEYLQAYFQPSKGYADRYYQAALRAAPRPELHCMFDATVLDFDLTAIPGEDTWGWATGPANPTEERGFLAAMRRRFPELYLSAIDLSTMGVRLGRLTEQYAKLGLQRDRKLLVHRQNEKVMAYALLEISSPGLTLNGCHEGFWLFEADSAKSPDAATWRPLVLACLQVYRDLGRSRIKCFTLLKDPKELLGPGVTVHPNLCIWTARADAAADVRRAWQHVYGTYELGKLGLL